MAKKISKNIAIAENIDEIETSTKTVNGKYKTEKCKVLNYNDKTQELDIDFQGYGIRLHNVENIDSDYVKIKYLGEIGKVNFSYEL